MAEREIISGSTTVFYGTVFSVRVDEIASSDRSHRSDVVVHPGSVAILAQPDSDSVVLIRQYRHAVGATLWELPAGTMESGESPQTCAERELREETGYSASRFERLWSIAPTPGYSSEIVHFYRATELRTGTQSLDPGESIEVVPLRLEKAWRLQASELILDMKTVLALSWLRSERHQ